MRLKLVIGMLVLMMFCQSACGEEFMYIRIISSKETEAAQAEKMAVREAVLPLIPDDLGDLESRLLKINEAANAIAPCKTVIRLWAPNGMPLRPALYITIGKGEGSNWWGILYPKGMEILARETGEEGIEFVWPLLARLMKWLKIR